jgi:hypothetical protein
VQREGPGASPAVYARRGRGPCEAVGTRVRWAQCCGGSRARGATAVVTGSALLPGGRVLQRRRARPHGHGRSPRGSWRPRGPPGRSPRVAPRRLCPPQWPPSTDTRPVSLGGAAAPCGAVPPRDDPPPGRRVGASTGDGAAVADGVAACGLTTVAWDSTGGDGLPLCERVASRGVAGRRVAPPPGQQSQGRPTRAGHDGPWRQRRHPGGRLAGACRPPDHGGVRRRDRRLRARCLRAASPPLPPRQQALPQLHRQRPPVVRDVTGATGRARRRAMRAGDRAPGPWARRRSARGHHDAETIATARHGPWRAAPRCAWAHAVARAAMSPQQSVACARQSAAGRAPCAACQARDAWPPGSRPRITGGDGTASAGLDEPTAVTRRSESGRNLGRWPPVPPVTAGLGRWPPHRVAGSPVCSRGTTPCAHRVATARRRAASCRPRQQRALGACCRRMHARRGPPTARTATAQTLARVRSARRHHGTADVRQRLADEAPHDLDRRVLRWTRRAKALGDARVDTPDKTPLSPSRPGSRAVAGPPWSRDRLALGAEIFPLFVVIF